MGRHLYQIGACRYKQGAQKKIAFTKSSTKQTSIQESIDFCRAAQTVNIIG